MHNKDMQFAEDNTPATKKDVSEALSAYATKEDLLATRDGLVREIALASARTEMKIEALIERSEAKQDQFRTQMTNWVDGFLSKVEGVRNGETILDHRVTNLEKRVTDLESRKDS